MNIDLPAVRELGVFFFLLYHIIHLIIFIVSRRQRHNKVFFAKFIISTNVHDQSQKVVNNYKRTICVGLFDFSCTLVDFVYDVITSSHVTWLHNDGGRQCARNDNNRHQCCVTVACCCRSQSQLTQELQVGHVSYRNIAKHFNRLRRAHERYRQTDRRQTDGRQHIANMNVSSRSLKTEANNDHSSQNVYAQ